MKLTDKELEEVKERRREGEASLACEGIVLTDEEKALFDQMEEERLSHEECRKRIDEYLDELIDTGDGDKK